MGLVAKQQDFAFNLGRLLHYIFYCGGGYSVTFADVFRSTDKLKLPGGKKMSYQELLVFNKKSKVKYGKHNMRLAADLILWRKGKMCGKEEYRQFGEYWETLNINNRWGGRFGVKKSEWTQKVGWDSQHVQG